MRRYLQILSLTRRTRAVTHTVEPRQEPSFVIAPAAMTARSSTFASMRAVVSAVLTGGLGSTTIMTTTMPSGAGIG